MSQGGSEVNASSACEFALIQLTLSSLYRSVGKLLRSYLSSKNVQESALDEDKMKGIKYALKTSIESLRRKMLFDLKLIVNTMIEGDVELGESDAYSYAVALKSYFSEAETTNQDVSCFMLLFLNVTEPTPKRKIFSIDPRKIVSQDSDVRTLLALTNSKTSRCRAFGGLHQ